jgi:DNA-binding sugar fermentation-stimulating protein
MDPIRLGHFIEPIFSRTQWEFPSGRFDFLVRYSDDDLWTIRDVKRVTHTETIGVFPDSHFTEWGVKRQLEIVLSEIAR